VSDGKTVINDKIRAVINDKIGKIRKNLKVSCFNFKGPGVPYVGDAYSRTPNAVFYIYLGNKETSCIFKTCCTIWFFSLPHRMLCISKLNLFWFK
jgi:hypothetical protein